jgi:FMN phosphatase YigB (HAD superfamily)
MRKLILTDIDGVCLDWSKQFNKFLKEYHPDKELMDPTVFAQAPDTAKLIEGYNKTAWIGFLEPHRDAKEVLQKFKNDGWQIIGCTSMGTDRYANALRKMNIESHFPEVFDKVDIIPFMEPKNRWLSYYKDSGAIWVEDKISNAKAGADIGLNTYLMKHEYNAFLDDKRIKKVDNWIQIYNENVV